MVRTYLYWQDRDKNVSRVQLNATDFMSPAEWIDGVLAMVGYMQPLSDATFIKAEQVYVYNADIDYPIDGSNIAIKTAIAITQDIDGNYVSYILPSPKDAIWDSSRNPMFIVAMEDAIAALKAALSTAGVISEQLNAVDIDKLLVIKAG